MFNANSRYARIADKAFELADGTSVIYKKRRFLPRAGQMTLLAEVPVTEGDRLDNITARTLGDPEQYWRICDANTTMNPAELTARIGRVLRVPVPDFGDY